MSTTKNDNEINFLSTADIHAGYPKSFSNKTISAIAKQLAIKNNRGVIVGKKTIYDLLVGSALYGGYSEISINKVNKEITIKLHNANQNDEIVINKKISYYY